jgi:hypothetical protein
MAVTFPTNPTTGQTYTYSNIVYTWDGKRWVRYNSAAIPALIGNSGRYLATDGIVLSWANGTPGFTGSAGPAGGYTGSSGYSGSTGFVGSQGPAGGYTGSASTAAGYTGSVGIGYTGSSSTVVGYTGSVGVGYTGSVGVGYTGSSSTVVGYTGSVGVGYTGSVGVGYTGSVGVGYTGSAASSAVTGPGSSISGNLASFNGTSGTTIADSGKAFPSGVIIGTTDTQTITNKTLTNPTITNYTETRYTATVTSNAITLDLANGTFQTITTMVGANAITLPAPASGKSLTVQIVYASTPTTLTFSSSSGALKYPGGTTPTPTLTNTKIDFYAFVSDGTNWYGNQSGANF